jgi:DNA-binding LacI/PurR family transcriptional regulator
MSEVAKLNDVARLAGVSRATASRVLSGSTETSVRARSAVRAAADQLGYQVNAAARALAMGRSGDAGSSGGDGGRLVVAVVGQSHEVLRDPYVAVAVSAVAEVAEHFGAGVGLEWLALGGSRGLHKLAADRSVRGVIVINTHDALLADIPRGLIGRIVSIGVGTPHVPSFDVDNAGAAEAIVHHLAQAGRREIVMVTGPQWLPCVRRQSQRFIDVMTCYGFEPRTVRGDFTTAGGAAGATEALRRWPGTDAVFASCDAAAIGALSVLHRRGMAVPHDVAVVGFDDIEFAALTTPALSTATHPVTLIASTAALALLEPSSADQLTHVFGSELVLRETA